MVDDNSSHDDQHRRRFLKLTGGAVGLSVGLAGCLGGDGGDGGGDGGGGGDGDGGGDGGPSPTASPTPGMDFPTDDITLVIPYSAGGGYDTYTRLVASHLPKYLPDGVGVQPQNVEGAGGRIATEQVFNADPDGYTLMINNVSGFAQAQVAGDVEYDLSEMTWFPMVANNKSAITVSTDNDVTTFEEYLTAVENDELRFGVPGFASLGAIAPIMVGRLGGFYEPAKIIDNAVAYDGTSTAMAAIRQGEVHAYASAISSLLPFVEEGIVRYVLYNTTEDAKPDVVGDVDGTDAETLATAGVDDAETISNVSSVLRVFAGPPGIPDDRTAYLRDALAQTIQDEEFLAAAEEAGRPVTFRPGEEMPDVVSSIVSTWEDNRELLEQLLGES